MNKRQMQTFTGHFDRYFQQTDCTVLHPTAESGLHVDVLLYEPNEAYPFWKLVTMGVSDYKMPPIPNTISRQNEYMLFVEKEVDLHDKEEMLWYYNKLMTVATYAYECKTHITYSHSFEWENEDPGDEMIAAFIEFPQIIEDVGILRCKLGLFKTVACLQVVLLNKKELDQLMEMGPEAFSNYLYPEEDGKPHFLSQRHRSGKF